jgi:hypothetical protein
VNPAITVYPAEVESVLAAGTGYTWAASVLRWNAPG